MTLEMFKEINKTKKQKTVLFCFKRYIIPWALLFKLLAISTV